MTRLGKMMLEELQRRNYSEITIRKYLQYVTAFARHFGKSPDQLGPNELRSYQAYLLQERKVTPGTRALHLVSIFRSFLLFCCFLFGGLARSSRSLGVDPGHLLGCSVAFTLVFELLVGVLAIFPEDKNADVLRGGPRGCGLPGS
jgi:hypothetical protein